VNNNVKTQIDDAYSLLDSSYVEFRAGNNDIAKSIANDALSVGIKLENDSLTGDALTSLCRTALRDHDSAELNKYSNQLRELSKKTNDETWLMIHSHMNAEMARMNGDLDKASELYDISLRISKSIGSMNMYWADHFNKSFIEVARGNISESYDLVKKYYEIQKEIDPENDDAYGLIAIANILLHQGDLVGAAEVSLVARRLFKEQNIIPDPADEKPLYIVEEVFENNLSPVVKDSLTNAAMNLSVKSILDKYLK
jgi:tetratricopeptide (TPR) repeat protein